MWLSDSAQLPSQLHAGHSCGDDQLGHTELGLDKSETARMRGRLSLLLTLETSWGAHTRTPVRSKPGSLHMRAHVCTHTTSLKRLEAAASWASFSYNNNWLHLNQTAPWRQGVLCHLPQLCNPKLRDSFRATVLLSYAQMSKRQSLL